MPTPNKGETLKKFLKRCIPIVLKDGAAKSTDQAVAICASMFRSGKRRSAELLDTITKEKK